MRVWLILALLSFVFGSVVNYDHYACCLPSGICAGYSNYYCTHFHHGVIVGYNATGNGCDSFGALCPGACCMPDRCDWVTEAECCGVYRGNGSSCDFNCTGACCSDCPKEEEEALCTEVNQWECLGTWQAIGTKCEPNGACPSFDAWLIVAAVFGALLLLIVLIVLCLIFRRRRAGKF